MRFQACFHKLPELLEALGCAFLNHKCDHRLEPVAHVDHHYLRVAIIEPEVAWLSPVHRLLLARDILSHNIVQDGEIRGFDGTVRCSLDFTSRGLVASSYLSEIILGVLHSGYLRIYNNTHSNLEWFTYYVFGMNKLSQRRKQRCATGNKTRKQS